MKTLTGQIQKINRLSGQLTTPRAAPGGGEFKDVYIDALTEKFSETLPMTFTTTADALEDYCIYGNDGGVGDLVDSRYLIPVKIIGKNLFDKDNAEVVAAYPNNSSGQVTDGSSNYSHSLVIPLTQGDYTFSMFSPKTQNVRNRFRVACYSTYPAVGTIAISSIYESGATRDGDYTYLSFTAPAETAYALVFLWSWSVYTSDVINQVIANNELQLEYGNVRTEYQSYSGNTVNINVDHPLYFDDVLTMADTGVIIPTVVGSNYLTVGTTVQPAAVQIKYQS